MFIFNKNSLGNFRNQSNHRFGNNKKIAYREQAKNYQPDKVRTPEEKRKYAIKFIEIKEA